MNITKKILYGFSIFLVLISNIGYAFSTVYCEMTENSNCVCSMSDKKNQTENDIHISSYQQSCCTVETKFISNSSDFESLNYNFSKDFSDIFFAGNQIPITSPSSIVSGGREILIFYRLPADIPLMYSSLLI